MCVYVKGIVRARSRRQMPFAVLLPTFITYGRSCPLITLSDKGLKATHKIDLDLEPRSIDQ